MQETSGMNTGVAGRLNSWKNKTPEPDKTAPAKPAVNNQSPYTFSHINKFLMYASMLRIPVKCPSVVSA